MRMLLIVAAALLAVVQQAAAFDLTGAEEKEVSSSTSVIRKWVHATIEDKDVAWNYCKQFLKEKGYAKKYTPNNCAATAATLTENMEWADLWRLQPGQKIWLPSMDNPPYAGGGDPFANIDIIKLREELGMSKLAGNVDEIRKKLSDLTAKFVQQQKELEEQAAEVAEQKKAVATQDTRLQILEDGASAREDKVRDLTARIERLGNGIAKNTVSGWLWALIGLLVTGAVLLGGLALWKVGTANKSADEAKKLAGGAGEKGDSAQKAADEACDKAKTADAKADAAVREAGRAARMAELAVLVTTDGSVRITDGLPSTEEVRAMKAGDRRTLSCVVHGKTMTVHIVRGDDDKVFLEGLAQRRRVETKPEHLAGVIARAVRRRVEKEAAPKFAA